MGFHSPNAPLMGLAATAFAAASTSAQAALTFVDLDTDVDIIISSIRRNSLEKLEQGSFVAGRY
jgi:hypothetical protein